MVFCSLACRQEATATFHQMECGNLHLLKPGTNYLALRAITRKSLKYFLDRRLDTFTTYDNTSGSDKDIQSLNHSQDMARLFHLARSEGGLEQRMEVYMVAVYLLRILQQMGYFGEKTDTTSLSEEEVYIGMLIAHFVTVAERNSQNINILSSKHKNLVSLADIINCEFEPVSVGCGIHPTLAMVNHSCDPNTVKVQQGGKTFLLAARQLQVGEEVLDNYGVLFYSTPRLDRWKELGFECQCFACANQWPMLHQLSSSLDLSACPSPLTAAGSLEKGRMANSLMARMTSELSAGHYNRVISLCGEYHSLLERLVARPHRFHFNTYMLLCYSAWARWGARQ